MKIFNRKEIKFECNEQIADRLILKIVKLGFKPEKNQIITNLTLENPKTITFDNYQRVRVRQYSSTPENLFIELRVVKGLKVIKKRIQLFQEGVWNHSFLRFIKNKSYIAFLGNITDLNAIRKVMKKRELKPYLFIQYKRSAWNNKKLKIRITLDSEIKYFALQTKLSEFKTGKLLGSESITIVKFKYVNSFPKNIKDLQKGLKKPRSKMKRAKYFLEKARK